MWISILSTTHNYPIKIFMPFFNILCFALFYKLSLEYVDKEVIKKTLKYLKLSVGLVAVYAILQTFNLDQFYNGLLGNKGEVVGTIGNQSHLAGFLGILLPIFYGSWWLIPIIIAILLTKSASGIAIGVLVFLIYLIYKQRYVGLGLSILTLTFGVLLAQSVFPDFFSFSHRLSVWHKAWDMIQLKAITGSGLGTFGLANVNGIDNITSHWRHAHNEYLQAWFEVGLVGLSIIIWGIFSYFKNFKINIKLSLVFLGFCLLGLVNFSSHLWLIAMVGMISYSWLYSLKNEVDNA
uniref:Putative O-antigen ligase n=1 Tax=viral metagenome TaxID=1070528 RepID=A0A6M3KJB8_9ZZZZ